MTSKLIEISAVIAGHSFRGRIENIPGGEVAVVQMKDVDPEKGLNCDDLYWVNMTGRKKPDYLRQGDILFVGRGYRIFAVLVDKDLEQTVAGPHFFIIKKNRVSPEYLTWYINHKRAQRYFARHVEGSDLPYINRTILEKLPVILPPLAVQEQIVNVHHCRLKEKALLEQLIAKKKQFLDQLLDQTLEQYQEEQA
jgi:restriction endonuclease S subunit